ncbi:MAG: DUF2752 domain-containing protein [Candidatus Azobacteroides sp.]|nr:DUF2752 domain-containing protein [Candidatus Azobacteroides sp.]
MGMACALFILAFPYFIMLTNQGDDLEKKQSFCPHKLITGLPCPGCGITKSFISFYEGDIHKSISYNVFGPLAVGICIFITGLLTVEIITKKEFLNNFLHSKKLAYVCAFLLAGYHLIRTVYFISTHSITEILKESIWM